MLASHTSVPASIDTVLPRVYLSDCTCTSVELRIVTTYSEQEKGEQHMSIYADERKVRGGRQRGRIYWPEARIKEEVAP
jgi:hypothetical protein